MFRGSSIRNILNRFQNVAVAVKYESSAASVKPFVFQDILEQDHSHDIPWKKLTSLNYLLL